VKFHFHFFTPAVTIRERKRPELMNVADLGHQSSVAIVSQEGCSREPISSAGIWKGCMSSATFSVGSLASNLFLLRHGMSVYLVLAFNSDTEKIFDQPFQVLIPICNLS
jgi:hypothetical protein